MSSTEYVGLGFQLRCTLQSVGWSSERRSRHLSITPQESFGGNGLQEVDLAACKCSFHSRTRIVKAAVESCGFGLIFTNTAGSGPHAKCQMAVEVGTHDACRRRSRNDSFPTIGRLNELVGRVNQSLCTSQALGLISFSTPPKGP